MLNYSEYDKAMLPVCFFMVLALALLLGVHLRHKSEWVRRIPTSMIALALLFLEVLKQRWNTGENFGYYYLPFHYCSLFLLFIPLAELFGARMARIFRPIATVMAFVVMCGMYLFPSAILGSASEKFGTVFYSTHTFIIHHLVVLYFLLVVTLDLYRPRFRDTLSLAAVGVLYLAMAIPLAYRYDTNYCNILWSTVPQLETIRVEHGQVIYTAVLAAFLTLGMMLGTLLCRIVYSILVYVLGGRRHEDDE